MEDVVEQILFYKKYLEKYLEKTPEQIKILHVLKKLKKLPVTLEHLHETGVGKIVNSYRKHEGDIGPKVKELIHQWKALVPEESNKKENEGSEETPGEISDRRSTKDSVSSPEQSPIEHTNTEEPESNNIKLNNTETEISHKVKEDSHQSKHDDHSRHPKHKSSRDSHHHRSGSSSSNRNEKHETPRDKSKTDERSKDRDERSKDRLNDRDKNSKERDENSKEKVERSKDRDQHSKDRVERSKDQDHHSKDRVETSKGRDQHSKDRVERSKDRDQHSKDRVERSKDRDQHSKDRVERSKDRDQHSKERVERSKDRDQRSKDRDDKSKDKSKSSRLLDDRKSEEKSKSEDSCLKERNEDKKSKENKLKERDSKGNKMDEIKSHHSESYEKKSHDRKHDDRKSSSHRLEKSTNDQKTRSDEKSSKEHDRKTKKSDKSHHSSDSKHSSKSKEVSVHMDTTEQSTDFDSLTAKIENFRERLNGDFDIFASEENDNKEPNKEINKTTSESENKRKNVSDVKIYSKEKKANNSKPKETKVSKIPSNSVHFAEEVEKIDESGNESQDHEGGNDGLSFEDMLMGLGTTPVPKKKKKMEEVVTKSLHESKSEVRAPPNGKSSHSEVKHKHSSRDKDNKSSDKHKQSSDKHHSRSKSDSKTDSKSSTGSKSLDKSRSSKESSSHKSSKHHSSNHTSSSSSKSSSSHHRHKSEPESRKRKSETHLDIPKPSKEIKLDTTDLVGSLPEINPNYKPLPHIPLGFLSPHKKDSEQNATLKRGGRTAVFSGRKTFYLTAVPRLYDACLRVLMDNIDALDYVGGVPYDILEPVLKRCTPMQLYNIEDANPTFIQDTDELWKKHAIKEFKKCQPNADDCETWRELYLRRYDERENKLKQLAANIAKSKVQAQPVKTTVLAYVDGPAKAPRDVRRRQIIHGTAGPSKTDPLAKLTSHKQEGAPKAPRPPIPKPEKQISPRKHTKTVAPMMRKSLKQMKNWKIHRK